MDKKNKFLKNFIIFIVVAIGLPMILGGILLVFVAGTGSLSGFNISYFLSVPSFGIVIGPVLAIIMVTYLVPITLTTYDKIIKFNYKETLLISGVIGTFVGWNLISKIYVSTQLTMDQIQNLWVGYSASLITILYSLVLAFLFIESFVQESNIEPDKNCFKKVQENKSINYRFFIGQFISYFSIIGSVAYALYVEGVDGSLANFFINIPAVIFISLIFILTALKTGNRSYFKSFKILFYDQYGNYDIRGASLSIRTAKDFIISISILILFMFFIASLNMNLGETFSAIGSMSLSLIYLLALYQLIVIQDVLILQNTILNDKFHEYTYQDKSSRIYVLIAVFLGILSFILLLSLIRT